VNHPPIHPLADTMDMEIYRQIGHHRDGPRAKETRPDTLFFRGQLWEHGT